MIHNGKTLNESMAMLRFVGKNHGYYPEDDHEKWACDATIDMVSEMTPKWA